METGLAFPVVLGGSSCHDAFVLWYVASAMACQRGLGDGKQKFSPAAFLDAHLLRRRILDVSLLRVHGLCT